MKTTAQFNAYHKAQHRTRSPLAPAISPAIPDQTDELRARFNVPDTNLGERTMKENAERGARLRGEAGKDGK